MAMIEGRTGLWEIVIGMEIHAQVLCQSKLFSDAPTAFGAEPNAQVSLVDAAFPGTLPVLNAYCVEQAVKTGLGLEAEINLTSVFERKNYFYADLPAGYQISQYLTPIVGQGHVMIETKEGGEKRIGITRLHLEQDAGKSLHDQHPQKSFIDLNRAGVPLMEIVSEPDLRSAEEAGAFLKKLRQILMYLNTCGGNLEQGEMRADINISVRKPGAPYGTRCEVKNINSVRFIQQAVEYEVRRQIELIEDGGSVVQETRLFDAEKGETRSMRSKEHAHDYRYFPDPDLLPLELTPEYVAEIKSQLIELPDAKKTRFIKEYQLSPYDAEVLVSERNIADYFEQAAGPRDKKLVANWIIGTLFSYLNKEGLAIHEAPITPDCLGALIDLIQDGTLSARLAKDVFDALWTNPNKTPLEIVEEKGLKQDSNQDSLRTIIATILTENPEMVAEYKSGKDKLFGFFVGQVMKQTQGKANPQLVNQILKEALA